MRTSRQGHELWLLPRRARRRIWSTKRLVTPELKAWRVPTSRHRCDAGSASEYKRLELASLTR